MGSHVIVSLLIVMVTALITTPVSGLTCKRCSQLLVIGDPEGKEDVEELLKGIANYDANCASGTGGATDTCSALVTRCTQHVSTMEITSKIGDDEEKYDLTGIYRACAINNDDNCTSVTKREVNWEAVGASLAQPGQTITQTNEMGQTCYCASNNCNSAKEEDIYNSAVIHQMTLLSMVLSLIISFSF